VSENVEIVRRMNERFAAGDRESWREVIHPDVVWDMSRSSMPGQAHVYRGHEGVVRFFRDWLGTWQDYGFEERELIDAGDSVVVVFREHGRGKGSGIEIEQEFFGVWDLRDGRIVRFRAFDSKAEALAAVGLTA
jgi:ketosteroid isomerase-like protein